MTTMAMNGQARQLARPLQFNLNGELVPIVHYDPDRAGALLDEYDTAITALDQALAERNAAAALWDQADRTYRIAHERAQAAKLALLAQLATGEVQ